jgi:hypothetical protein
MSVFREGPPNQASMFLQSVFARKYLYAQLFQLIYERTPTNKLGPINFDVIDWSICDIKVEQLNGMKFGYPKGCLLVTIDNAVTVEARNGAKKDYFEHQLARENALPAFRRNIGFSMCACVSGHVEFQWRVDSVTRLEDLLFSFAHLHPHSVSDRASRSQTVLVDLHEENRENIGLLAGEDLYQYGTTAAVLKNYLFRSSKTLLNGIPYFENRQSSLIGIGKAIVYTGTHISVRIFYVVIRWLAFSLEASVTAEILARLRCTGIRE